MSHSRLARRATKSKISTPASKKSSSSPPPSLANSVKPFVTGIVQPVPVRISNHADWLGTGNTNDWLALTSHMRGATACAATNTSVSFTIVNGTGSSGIISWAQSDSCFTWHPTTQTVQKRRIGQLAPAILKNHRNAFARSFNKDVQFSNASPAELIALQLLRQMVPHEEFRRYLRHGFIGVFGASGLHYQISRTYSTRIVVRDRGERIASLCVHLKDAYMPPTDEVVGKMLIVQCDEVDIWRRSNITWETQNLNRENLNQIRSELGPPKGVEFLPGGVYLPADRELMMAVAVGGR